MSHRGHTSKRPRRPKTSKSSRQKNGFRPRRASKRRRIAVQPKQFRPTPKPANRRESAVGSALTRACQSVTTTSVFGPNGREESWEKRGLSSPLAKSIVLEQLDLDDWLKLLRSDPADDFTLWFPSTTFRGADGKWGIHRSKHGTTYDLFFAKSNSAPKAVPNPAPEPASVPETTTNTTSFTTAPALPKVPWNKFGNWIKDQGKSIKHQFRWLKKGSSNG